MSHLTGFYRVATSNHYLAFDDQSEVYVKQTKPSTRMRPNKEFWLSIDDGQLGKYGNPKQLKATIQGKQYRLWVEPRGPSKYGIIPTNNAGDYSNQFLSIDSKGILSISDDWLADEEFMVETD
ncbi:hypothetical protein EX895_002997 [Sporisorium graminicola]|uniref:Uncharacterized protein n=1 Tax=Sporisorium graminicola TaxID=280036 RepID=A0A4U7KTN8_9BASI|nr:hypothetical protein EX895_002997 [Sporisorium graminicola]TKY87901.1 hypothetical protein EX895_002997 [Sporisorium graminicola]